MFYLLYILNTNEIPTFQFNAFFFCCERYDFSYYHVAMTTEDNMLFSHVEILVFTYDKNVYFSHPRFEDINKPLLCFPKVGQL